MASGIARGRVRTTTTTATWRRKMAAILQKRVWQRHEALVLLWTSLKLDIHATINWHLSKQGICWPVVRGHIAGSSLQVIRDHMFLGSWRLTNYWFSDWIAGSCQVNLLKTGQDCSEAVTFFFKNLFLMFSFVYMVIVKTENRSSNNIQKTSRQSYKTQIKILPFSGLA